MKSWLAQAMLYYGTCELKIMTIDYRQVDKDIDINIYYSSYIFRAQCRMTKPTTVTVVIFTKSFFFNADNTSIIIFCEA